MAPGYEAKDCDCCGAVATQRAWRGVTRLALLTLRHNGHRPQLIPGTGAHQNPVWGPNGDCNCATTLSTPVARHGVSGPAAEDTAVVAGDAGTAVTDRFSSPLPKDHHRRDSASKITCAATKFEYPFDPTARRTLRRGSPEYGLAGRNTGARKTSRRPFPKHHRNADRSDARFRYLIALRPPSPRGPSAPCLLPSTRIRYAKTTLLLIIERKSS